MYNKVLLFFIFIHIVFLKTESYKMFRIDDCDTATFSLKEKNKSGLILNIGRLRHHQIDWTRNFHCKFQVNTGNPIERFLKPPKGIFIVVQSLSFRRDEITGLCIDYILFRLPNGTDVKMCDQFEAYDMMENDDFDHETLKQIPPNGFIINPGKSVEVIVHIDKRKLNLEEHTDVLVIFTSYSQCDRYLEYRPCSNTHNAYYDKCIYGEYFNDSYINCPFKGCLDEYGCIDLEKPKIEGGIGGSVMIGAIASLVLLFLIFLGGLWICRKFSKFCWREQHRNFLRAGTQETRPNENLRHALPPEPVLAAPTAPPLQSDKDLPPSYSSLFPDR